MSNYNTAVFIRKPDDKLLELRIKDFVEYLKTQPIVQKNLCDYVWISGESTEVFPIMVWQNFIELQWKSDRPCPRFISAMREKYPDIIKSGYFSKSDGSCPSTIYFNLQKNLW